MFVKLELLLTYIPHNLMIVLLETDYVVKNKDADKNQSSTEQLLYPTCSKTVRCILLINKVFICLN